MSSMTHTAKNMWLLTPCSIVTRKVAIPFAHCTVEHLKRATVPVPRTSQGQRPLRQRLCRFIFKEFVRSCGLGSGLARIQPYHIWQAVLAVGVIAVLAVRI
jgi:hypothetical protein